jgi:RNA polymerase sporulation-specific sigma factor
MSRHKVNIVGVNTSNIKVLSNDKMQELFIKLKNGDTNAREEIANGNLKLVLSILKKFSTLDENKDDLFQIGCIGLMKAIDNFDPNFGVKFSTYCVPMILGEIRRYVRDNTSLRVSRSLKDLAYKCNKAKEELSLKMNKIPTNLEIANYIGASEYEVSDALNSKKEPISVFEPIYNDGGDTIYLCDQIEDKSEKVDLSTKISLKDALKELEERERYILDQRFVIGKTQVELSEELNISQAQISRIEKKAIDTLKKKMS